MIKLFRFLLPICIILLSGYAQQNRNTYNGSVYFSFTKNPEGFIFGGHNSILSCQDLSIRPALSDSERESNINHAAKLEEKEDELATFKKYIDVGNHFASAFYITTSEYFSCHTKRYLFFSKHFSYFPFFRSLYLKFNVIRI